MRRREFIGWGSIFSGAAVSGLVGCAPFHERYEGGRATAKKERLFFTSAGKTCAWWAQIGCADGGREAVIVP